MTISALSYGRGKSSTIKHPTLRMFSRTMNLLHAQPNEVTQNVLRTRFREKSVHVVHYARNVNYKYHSLVSKEYIRLTLFCSVSHTVIYHFCKKDPYWLHPIPGVKK